MASVIQLGRRLNQWAVGRQLAEQGIGPFVNAGAPTDGTSGTYAGYAAPGAILYDYTNGAAYLNVNTKASPIWTKTQGNSVFRQASGTISSANIVGTGAGQFGHAAGVTLLAAPGATLIAELISLVMFYDFAVAAYTAGGNITVNRTGGAAITGVVSNANSVANAADKVAVFMPLAAAAEVVAPNVGFSLVAATAFTQPGTAAGVVRWLLNYRIHATGF